MDPREKKEIEKPEELKNIPQESTEQKEKEEKKEEDFRGKALNRVLRKIYEEEGGPKIRLSPLSAGRFAGRTLGRGAGGAGKGAARLGERLAVQAGMMAGRAAASGIAAIVANPISLIVIGVIIVIVIIVFLIIIIAGQDGGGGGRKLWNVDCFDPNGNNIVVADGNSCAQSLAEYYTNIESPINVTATCIDKCTNGIISCDKNPAYNRCSDDPNACIIQDGFCIKYTPEDATKKRVYDCAVPEYYFKTGLFVSSCRDVVSSPTPSPTPP